MPFFEADAKHFASTSKTQMQGRYGGRISISIRQFAESVLRRSGTRENNFGFDWLPRVTGDHSHLGYWLEMAKGKVEGLFVMGQNPAVGAPNSRLERKALAKLKWLVVRDMVETETASSGVIRPRFFVRNWSLEN